MVMVSYLRPSTLLWNLWKAILVLGGDGAHAWRKGCTTRATDPYAYT